MIIDPHSLPSYISSSYPPQFQEVVKGRSKKRLGNASGLTNFGVNLVFLEPGSCSALRHWHLKQDEFIYVLAGEITLVTNQGEQKLSVGDCAGFPAGEEDGHHLFNKSEQVAQYLEIGDRTKGDIVSYPDDDLVAKDSERGWVFTNKQGQEYD